MDASAATLQHDQCEERVVLREVSLKTRQGIKNFTREEAEEMKGKDPDYAQPTC